jgi:hypothetical protein
MDDLIIGFIFGCALFGLLTYIINVIRIRKLENDIDNAIRDSLKRLKDMIISSRLEVENGMIYLYNKETNQFLGQGKNMKELNDVVMVRFPGKLFNVSSEQLEKVKDM